MRIAILAPFLAFFLAMAASASEAPAPSLDTVAWLRGCWTMTRPDGFTEEHWLRPAGGAMLGISRTIRRTESGERMTEYEFILIHEVNGRLAFVAKPSGQPEAVFPLVRSSDGELVFEDPAHDFPQRVIYRKVEGGLAARIEGTVKGQLRTVEFPYRSCGDGRM